MFARDGLAVLHGGSDGLDMLAYFAEISVLVDMVVAKDESSSSVSGSITESVILSGVVGSTTQSLSLSGSESEKFGTAVPASGGGFGNTSGWSVLTSCVVGGGSVAETMCDC